MAVIYEDEEDSNNYGVKGIKNPTLQELLDKVDYSTEYYNYIPSQEAIEYSTLMAAIYGGEFENKTPIMHFMMFDALHSGKNICIVAHRGSGKALALDTVINTTKGPKLLKDVKRGDSVINRFGRSAKVLAKSKIFEEATYRLTFSDGRIIESCGSHDWRYRFENPINYINKPKYKKYDYFGYEDKFYVNTTKQIYHHLFSTKYRKARTKRPSPIKIELKPTISFDSPTPIIPVSLFISAIYNKDPINSDDVMKVFIGCKQLDGLTVLTHKRDFFIPDIYKYGSLNDRIMICRYFIKRRTDKKRVGYYESGSNKRLIDDLVTVTRSLGILCRSTIYKVNRWFASTAIREVFTSMLYGVYPEQYAKVSNIEEIEPKPTQCLRVGDYRSQGSFMVNDYIPTNNSTVMAQNLFFYIAIYGELPRLGRVKFAIYVSDTLKNGCKTMTSNMEYTYKNSDFLQKMIPTAKFTQDLWEMTNLNGQMLSVRIYGAESGIRGGREQNTRPNLAVIDDVLNDKNAVSKTKLIAIKKVIFAAINYALHPKNLKILIGTPFHNKCVVSEAVASGTYYNIIFPIAEKFPCEESEFRGSWTDRFGYEEVLKMYLEAEAGIGDLTIQGFYQEVMLSPAGKDRTVVKESMIRRFSRAELINRSYDFRFYITTDFATTEDDASDLSVILVWAYGDGGVFHLVDGYAGKSLMDVNIDLLFDFVSKYPIEEVGIETNGQQGGFIAWIRQQMKSRGVSFKLATSDPDDNIMAHTTKATKLGVKSIGNKMQRFNNIQPLFASKSISVSMEHYNMFYVQEFLEEILSITPESLKNALYDDVIDATSQIQYLKVFTEAIEEKLNNTGIDFEKKFEFSREEIVYTTIMEARKNTEVDNVNNSYIV